MYEVKGKMPLSSGLARRIMRSRGYRDRRGRRIRNAAAYARGMVRRTYGRRRGYSRRRW